MLAALIGLVYWVLKTEKQKQYYEKQGVKFGRFATLYDGIAVIVQSVQNKYDLPFIHMMKKRLGVNRLPPFTGTVVFGMPIVLICDPDALEDLYIKKNAAYSKHELERQFGDPLFKNNIATMVTEHPEYATKRKVLSSAFFKNKVQRMVNMVKETTLDQFAKLQAKGDKVEVNLTQYTQ